MQGHVYLIGWHVLLQKREDFNVLEDKNRVLTDMHLLLCDECVIVVYLVEVVDVIQHLYARKATIVIERLWGRSKLSKTVNREEYGKKVILEDQLTLFTARTKENN